MDQWTKFGIFSVFVMVLMAAILSAGNAALPEKRVFVTNNTHLPDFGGLRGGDALCNQTAANANLGGSWMAWLSIKVLSNTTNNTIINVKDRIIDAKYVRLDGRKIADDKADLLDGTIDNAINVTEFGTYISSFPYYIPGVYTGTNETGMATGADCTGWTNTTDGGTYGSQAKNNKEWTNIGVNYCSAQRRLYCFEK